MAEKLEGVFLFKKEAKIGTGHTVKKVIQEMFCMAKELETGEVEIRYLGANDKPMDVVEKIPLDQFLHSFTFQPYYFAQKKADKDTKASKFIAVAEEHAKRKEFFSAEYEFKNALKVDNENLKANFGIGNVYLAMGEKEKAKDIFIKISHVDAIFEEENKHFFNECAIQLRKQELYAESIDYYEKALGLSPNDENLYFNLARAYFEKGEQDKAKEYIHKALEIQPSFKEGKALLAYIDQKSSTPLPS
ncbi:MAG: tetratricopeptide repeat protein [Pseudomonadota bacterium]